MKKILCKGVFWLAAWAIVTGCSRSEALKPEVEGFSLLPKVGSLHYDQTLQFSIRKGGNPFPASNFNWKVADENIAGINKEGLLTAKTIGETHITATNGAETLKVAVAVVPYHTFIKAPVLGFGNSKAHIKNLESRKLISETKDFLIYEGENDDVKRVTYFFDEDALHTVAVSTPAAVKTKLEVYARERYSYISQNDNGMYFSSWNEKVDIALGKGSNGDATLIFSGE